MQARKIVNFCIFITIVILFYLAGTSHLFFNGALQINAKGDSNIFIHNDDSTEEDQLEEDKGTLEDSGLTIPDGENSTDEDGNINLETPPSQYVPTDKIEENHENLKHNGLLSYQLLENYASSCGSFDKMLVVNLNFSKMAITSFPKASFDNLMPSIFGQNWGITPFEEDIPIYVAEDGYWKKTQQSQKVLFNGNNTNNFGVMLRITLADTKHPTNGGGGAKPISIDWEALASNWLFENAKSYVYSAVVLDLQHIESLAPIDEKNKIELTVNENWNNLHWWQSKTFIQLSPKQNTAENIGYLNDIFSNQKYAFGKDVFIKDANGLQVLPVHTLSLA